MLNPSNLHNVMCHLQLGKAGEKKQQNDKELLSYKMTGMKPHNDIRHLKVHTLEKERFHNFKLYCDRSPDSSYLWERRGQKEWLGGMEHGKEMWGVDILITDPDGEYPLRICAYTC